MPGAVNKSNDKKVNDIIKPKTEESQAQITNQEAQKLDTTNPAGQQAAASALYQHDAYKDGTVGSVDGPALDNAAAKTLQGKMEGYAGAKGLVDEFMTQEQHYNSAATPESLITGAAQFAQENMTDLAVSENYQIGRAIQNTINNNADLFDSADFAAVNSELKKLGVQSMLAPPGRVDDGTARSLAEEPLEIDSVSDDVDTVAADYEVNINNALVRRQLGEQLTGSDVRDAVKDVANDIAAETTLDASEALEASRQALVNEVEDSGRWEGGHFDDSGKRQLERYGVNDSEFTTDAIEDDELLDPDNDLIDPEENIEPIVQPPATTPDDTIDPNNPNNTNPETPTPDGEDNSGVPTGGPTPVDEGQGNGNEDTSPIEGGSNGVTEGGETNTDTQDESQSSEDSAGQIFGGESTDLNSDSDIEISNDQEEMSMNESRESESSAIGEENTEEQEQDAAVVEEMSRQAAGAEAGADGILGTDDDLVQGA
jgi:hypothetical protein